MKDTKKSAIFFTLWGIFCFIIFAFDIEYDRDIWTWLWLLTSIISFMGAMRNWIVYDRELNDK